MSDARPKKKPMYGFTQTEMEEFNELFRPVPGASAATLKSREARWIELFLKHQTACIQRVKKRSGRKSSLAAKPRS